MSGSKWTTLVKTGITGDVQEKITASLLIGATVESIDTTDDGGSLQSLKLRLKDGRMAELEEVNYTSWENSSVGCITIWVEGKEYP
jgi:hypothetical protein